MRLRPFQNLNKFVRIFPHETFKKIIFCKKAEFGLHLGRFTVRTDLSFALKDASKPGAALFIGEKASIVSLQE